jgi:hypothetical protein
VTVEYVLAAGTLDVFISNLLSAKMQLIGAVEADTPPDTSILRELEARLRTASPALLAELQAWRATGDAAARIEAIAAGVSRIGADAPIAEAGVHEFTSSRDPGKVYRVIWGTRRPPRMHLRRLPLAWRVQACAAGSQGRSGLTPDGTNFQLGDFLHVIWSTHRRIGFDAAGSSSTVYTG